MSGECVAATHLIVHNETNSPLTLRDGDSDVTGAVPTCSTPGGAMSTPERKEFYVACADDSQIEITAWIPE